MKTTLYFIIILSAFALSLISSCKDKDQPEPITEAPLEMPPFTDTGANTMAYKVNGEIVIAKSEANNGTGVIGNRFKSINPEDGYIFYCEGQFIKENHYETIVLSIEQLSDTGSFVLKTRTGEDYNQGQYRIGENSAINKVYVTTNQYRGKVQVIKLDTINQIISGKFFFTGEHFFGTDTVQITEGQFDIKYLN